MDPRFLPDIGVITGNFDVIHPGYVRLFQEFNDSCHRQFVLLHDDPTIERPEKIKPIHTVDERIEMLTPFFNSPTFLIYNTEAELLTILKAIRPDIRLLGDDYVGRSFTGDNLGIPVRWINRSHGWSTTKWKNKIAKTL